MVALEDIAGTTPSSALTTADNANILLLSAEPSFEAEQIDKNYLRTSLTKLKQQVGQKAGGVAATFELAGTALGTFVAGAPTWSKFLEMAGFVRHAVSRVEIGAITGGGGSTKSGPFRKGEAITFSGTGAGTGTVAMDCHSGETYLYFIDDATSATAAADTITATDTGCTATSVGAVEANKGYVWWPTSKVVKQVTVASASASVGAVYKGGSSGAVIVVDEALSSGTTLIYRSANETAIINSEVLSLVSGSGDSTIAVNASAAEQFVEWPTGSLRLNEDGVYMDFVGSRATASFEFTVNRPVSVTCTTRGLWSAVGDTPFITGAAPDIVDAPLWGGTAVGLALNEDTSWELLADEVSPCLRSLSVDMGVQLADHQCASATDGLLEVLGTGRDATGTLSGDANFEGFFPWLGKLRDGEVIRLRVNVGSTDGNKFIFHMPGIQATSASSGDQDGILTRDISIGLTGGVNDNLDGTPTTIGTAGEDNEFILMYITA